jgi:hypothetical protein
MHMTDAERASFYRAEGHVDEDGGRTLYRTFGERASTQYRPAAAMGTTRSTATTATLTRAERVQVAGYVLRWRAIGNVSEGVTESFADRSAIMNDGHDGPRLVLGHTRHGDSVSVGPTLSRDVAVQYDRTGMWCCWTLDPLLVDPDVLDWATSGERALSVGGYQLTPPIEHRRLNGTVHLNPTCWWISHVALMPPGYQAAYAGAHTEIL